MTTEEFNRLLENCKPHPVFREEWHAYYPTDFMDTLLPNAPKQANEAVLVCDGAELFAAAGTGKNELLKLPGANGPISLLTYTYPKGAEAQLLKDRVNVGEDECCTFMEVARDESIDVYFKPGRQLADYLRKQQPTSGGIAGKPFETNAGLLRNEFKNGMGHKAMMEFIGKTTGADMRFGGNKIGIEITDAAAWTNKKQGMADQYFISANFDWVGVPAHRFHVKAWLGQKMIFGGQIFSANRFGDLGLDLQRTDGKPAATEGLYRRGEYVVYCMVAQDLFTDAANGNEVLTISVEATAQVGGQDESVSDDMAISFADLKAKGVKGRNPTGFDRANVVVWLTEDYLTEKELLPKAQATAYLTTLVPAGAKLIRLKPESPQSEKTPCLFWWNGGYHIREFPEKLLGDTHEIYGDKAGLVFQNDVAHALDRAKYIKNANKELAALIKMVDERKGELFDTEKLSIALGQFKVKFHVDLEQRGETIARILRNIREVYEPMGRDGEIPMFDVVFYVHLSEYWFNKYADGVKTKYAELKQMEGFSGMAIEPGGGEVYEKGEVMDNVLAGMAELLTIEDVSDKRKETFEWQWLPTVPAADKLVKIILLSLDAWVDEKPTHASGIGLEVTHGMFKVPPLMTIMLHESSQVTEPSPIPEDSHTDQIEMQKMWAQLSENYSTLNETGKEIGYLYASDYQISIVTLAIILNQL